MSTSNVSHILPILNFRNQIYPQKSLTEQQNKTLNSVLATAREKYFGVNKIALETLVGKVSLNPNAEALTKILEILWEPCSTQISSFLKLDQWQSEGNIQEAKNRIINCWRHQWKKLDLSGLNLSSLPPCIKHFTQLTELDCHNNQLSILPKDIGELVNLNSLDFFHNNLKSLPKEIGRLTKINSFYIGGNQLESLPDEICNFVEMRLLSCCGNKLKFLPQNIGTLAKLRDLYCSNNELLALPRSIGDLFHLEVLYCPNNQLIYLPEEIAKLNSLQTIDISDNHFPSVPKELKDLKANITIGKCKEITPKTLVLAKPIAKQTTITIKCKNLPSDCQPFIRGSCAGLSWTENMPLVQTAWDTFELRLRATF